MQLSDESLQEFYRYQEDCEGQGLSEEDMFYLCEKKFNELLAHDKATAASKEPTQAKKDRRDLTIETRPMSSSDRFKPDKAHLAMMEHDHAEEESLSIELQALLTDADDLDLADFDQTYTQALVRKVFALDKYDHLQRIGMKEALPHDNDTGGGHSHSNGHHEEEEQHDSFLCRLCHICFDSKSALQSHFDFSELHRKNSKMREKRVEEAHNEAVRLTALAKNVMKALYMGLPIKPSPVHADHPPAQRKLVAAGSYEAILQEIEDKEQHHKEVQGKWKHALDKILHRRLCEKYTHHLMTRINVPRGVELLYEGSKYFLRTKTTYDLRYLHHNTHDVIEIIPHYVPYNHDSSTLEESDTNTFLAAKRIYLRFTEVVKAVFGFNIKHTELTDDLHFAEAPHVLTAKGSIHDMEVQAIDLFISNRLRIHKSHTADDALFFDLHGIAHETLLKELPRRFAPAPVDLEVIANIWRTYAAPTAASSELLTRQNTATIV